MSGRQNDHSVFIDKRIDCEVVAFGGRPPNEGDVDLPSTQSRHQKSGIARLRRKNDIRVLQSVFADNSWNEWMEISCTCGTDDELASFTARTTPHVALGRLHMFENDASFLQKKPSGIGFADGIVECRALFPVVEFAGSKAAA
jgi:hypothetical protein